MSQKVIIESLAMDLMRVALGMHHGSKAMANRFKEEALKRKAELKVSSSDRYLAKLLANTKKGFRIKRSKKC